MFIPIIPIIVTKRCRWSYINGEFCPQQKMLVWLNWLNLKHWFSNEKTDIKPPPVITFGPGNIALRGAARGEIDQSPEAFDSVFRSKPTVLFYNTTKLLDAIEKGFCQTYYLFHIRKIYMILRIFNPESSTYFCTKFQNPTKATLKMRIFFKHLRR